MATKSREYLIYGFSDAELAAAVNEYDAYAAAHPGEELAVYLSELATEIRALWSARIDRETKGVCENMYYLRADQRHLVEYDFSDFLEQARFRFPFPDEDGTAPGEFGDHDRSYPIPSSWQLPDDFTGHGRVQFVAQAGYNCCLPCPEGPDALADDVVRVHRNGWSGGPRIVQQAFREGDLATIVCCGACGAKWRLSADAALDVAAALEAEANRKDWATDPERRSNMVEVWHHGDGGRERILEIARRMLAGYTRERVTA